MKYILQILYVLLFSLAGEAFQALIPLPVPAAIYGIVLMALHVFVIVLGTYLIFNRQQIKN